jgi:hypothetical protein
MRHEGTSVEPDRVGGALVRVEIQDFAVRLGIENMAEQETFERRYVGDRDRRLDHSRGEIVGGSAN